jgi:hypothetical protein
MAICTAAPSSTPQPSTGWSAYCTKAAASASAQCRSQVLVTVRFCYTAWAFAFIREGLQRYQIEHTRFSKPLPGEHWWHHPNAPHVLEPGSSSDTHPYPVELDLPSWTVTADIDLRNWLFGFGAGIRIDSPEALRQELVDRSRQAIEANWEQVEVSPPAPEPAPQFFSRRLRGD